MAAHYARQCGEDADDLLQEAWLGLLEALPELDLAIGQPEQYLIARARWKMLDLIKRERVRRCISLDEVVVDAACPSAPDDAIGSACASEFASRLKANQRAVLGCLLCGLTWREAGERLGCASANIAYHVRGIRRRYEEWV
jgi:RNA polymerase sigma factor (sigma-70 family)